MVSLAFLKLVNSHDRKIKSELITDYIQYNANTVRRWAVIVPEWTVDGSFMRTDCGASK